MTKKVYEATYAGHPIRFAFQYPDTRWYFRSFVRASQSDKFDILASTERIERERTLLPEDALDGYAEYHSLIGLTARALLEYDCCIFHSASFIWRDKAFLLTAPSGTGKTSQYLNWQRLFPGEITMISGDMPVLERREDGSVWAHPTTWNGKENIGNRICAPVRGVVLLAQGQENSISPLEPRDEIQLLIRQFIVRPDTEKQIRALARLMDQMLRNIPCFKLVNRGDDASTALLRETLAPLVEGGSHDKL